MGDVQPLKDSQQLLAANLAVGKRNAVQQSRAGLVNDRGLMPVFGDADPAKTEAQFFLRKPCVKEENYALCLLDLLSHMACGTTSGLHAVTHHGETVSTLYEGVMRRKAQYLAFDDSTLDRHRADLQRQAKSAHAALRT